MSDSNSSNTEERVKLDKTTREICQTLENILLSLKGGDKINEIENHKADPHRNGSKQTENFTDKTAAILSSHSVIQIAGSQNIHVGNTINIGGPIVFHETTNRRVEENGQSYLFKDLTSKTQNPRNDDIEIIGRKFWLASPPNGEIEKLATPVKYVIICHSNTEESASFSENILLIRLIQAFHMESRHWNDIAYNFLIGGDGSIFEGRGWNLKGAHTYRYNCNSIGICFVGNFAKHRPTTKALENARNLINLGVRLGYILEDYILLGHCQCSKLCSPGKALFEEIQKWDNWDGSVSRDCAPLLQYDRNIPIFK